MYAFHGDNRSIRLRVMKECNIKQMYIHLKQKHNPPFGGAVGYKSIKFVRGNQITT